MITISCYAVHSIFAHFLSLWRWAQTATDWIIFMMIVLCHECLRFIGPRSRGSEKSVSGLSWFQISSQFDIPEAGEPGRQVNMQADTEVLIEHPSDILNEGLHADDHNILPPSVYIEQACGEPQGQQLILDLSPSAEVEIRNQLYELDSNHGSDASESSVYETSESEVGLEQAKGDHGDTSQRSDCSPNEVDESKSEIPELPTEESNNEFMCQSYESPSAIDVRSETSRYVIVENQKSKDNMQTQENADALQLQSTPVYDVRELNTNTETTGSLHSLYQSIEPLNKNHETSKKELDQPIEKPVNKMNKESRNEVDDFLQEVKKKFAFVTRNSVAVIGSEIEIKSYIYEQTSRVTDVDEIRKSANNYQACKPNEVNFPAVHNSRKS